MIDEATPAIRGNGSSASTVALAMPDFKHADPDAAQGEVQVFTFGGGAWARTTVPHIAGAQGTEVRRLGEYAVAEVARWLAGHPLQGRIRPEELARLA